MPLIRKIITRHLKFIGLWYQGRDEAWKEETIRNTSERQFRQEFETEFLGSSNTLISGYKLQTIAYRDPTSNHDLLKIYEYPVKEGVDNAKSDHLYCICVDVSEGKNLDSSAFQVIDISQTPYKQVAVMQVRQSHLFCFQP
jgi:hypothetical protein